MTYTSTLSYAGKSDDFGKLLKCKVDHFGIDEEDHHGQDFWVNTKLDLQFKPQEIKRLEGGDFNTVVVKFRANPEPIDGEWKIGDEIIPAGKTSENNIFRSSDISQDESQSYYQVNFTYASTMHKFDEKTFAILEITNKVGTTTQKFQLLPKTSSLGVIIGVIVVTIVIIVGILIFTLTKINKALCFKDQSEVEKGKNPDDAEAQEELTPKQKE